MALFTDSGQTPERRIEEAGKLLNRLADRTEEMSSKERGFVLKMLDSYEFDGVTPKQLFWMRDLVEKYGA